MQQEIRARRLCMVTEYRVKQKKLENQLKLEAKIHELEVSTIDFPSWTIEHYDVQPSH